MEEKLCECPSAPSHKGGRAKATRPAKPLSYAEINPCMDALLHYHVFDLISFKARLPELVFLLERTPSVRVAYYRRSGSLTHALTATAARRQIVQCSLAQTQLALSTWPQKLAQP